MHYERTVCGSFLRRINRFTAEAEIDGTVHLVHVKNTGRLVELLLPGAEIVLQHFDPEKYPARKTAYDLISVKKEGLGWVNIDSQVCNRIMEEWFQKNTGFSVRREVRHENSRFDFLLDENIYVEVKGCTLECNGTGYFPDAPTVRGCRHVSDLTKIVQNGGKAWIVFVLAMNQVNACQVHEKKDPEFAAALRNAQKNGVKIFHALCHVEPDEISVTELKAASCF